MSTHTDRCFARKSSGRYGHGIKLNHVNFIDASLNRVSSLEWPYRVSSWPCSPVIMTAPAVALTGVVRCRIPQSKRTRPELKPSTASTWDGIARTALESGQCSRQRGGGDCDLSHEAFDAARIRGACRGSALGRALYRQGGGDHRKRVVRAGVRPGRRRGTAEGGRRLREGKRQQDRVEHHALRAGTAE